jgi:hypothetical protein
VLTLAMREQQADAQRRAEGGIPAFPSAGHRRAP